MSQFVISRVTGQKLGLSQNGIVLKNRDIKSANAGTRPYQIDSGKFWGALLIYGIQAEEEDRKIEENN